MKREDVKKIFAEVTDEQLTAIMALNGKDIENLKSKAEKTENELKEKQTAFDEITKQFEELKKSNATAQDWEKKYTELQQDVATKEKERQEAQAKAERTQRINARFNEALKECGKSDADWNSPFIKNGYLDLFDKAVSADENASKSDKDILHELVKDDSSAFKNVTVTEIKGASAFVPSSKKDFAKMSYTEKAELFKSNPSLYEQMKGE